MQNTIKVSTFLWLLLALSIAISLMIAHAVVLARPISPILAWAIALLIVAYPTFRSYQGGALAGSRPETKPEKLKRWAATIGGLLVVGLMIFDAVNDKIVWG